MPMISANVAQPRDVVHGDAGLSTGIFRPPVPGGAAAVRRPDPDSDSTTDRLHGGFRTLP